jgi:hypothetical protein
MRAFFDIDRPTCRDRLAERRAGLEPLPATKRFARFEPPYLLLGVADQSRTKPARLWRTRLRIKRLIRPQGEL